MKKKVFLFSSLFVLFGLHTLQAQENNTVSFALDLQSPVWTPPSSGEDENQLSFSASTSIKVTLPGGKEEERLAKVKIIIEPADTKWKFAEGENYEIGNQEWVFAAATDSIKEIPTIGFNTEQFKQHIIDEWEELLENEGGENMGLYIARQGFSGQGLEGYSYNPTWAITGRYRMETGQ